MSARFMLMSATFAAFVAAWGCYEPNGQASGDDPPQAPAPRVQKSTAELLIGSWRMVKSSHLKVGPDFDRQIVFTADGKFNVRWEEPGELQKQTGMYSLTGRNIRLTSVIDADGPKTREGTIEAINENELKITAGPPHARQWDIYRRFKEK